MRPTPLSPRSSEGLPGIYNVVDDDPAPMRDWLPVYAEALGAKRPMRVPLFVARLFGGTAGQHVRERAARRLQREGEARARLAAGAPELAAGFRRLAGVSAELDAARSTLLAELREHALVIGEVTLSSGQTASYYVDARRALLRPRCLSGGRRADRRRRGGARRRARSAGPATAAIPLACAAIAAPAGDGLVGFFVRERAQGARPAALGRGPGLKSGARCLVVEDTVTTGGSTVKAIERMREEGLEIVGALSVVDRLAGGGEAIAAAADGAPYRALVSIDELYPDRPDR